MNETQKIHPGGVVENSPGWSVAQPGECPPIRGSRPVEVGWSRLPPHPLRTDCLIAPTLNMQAPKASDSPRRANRGAVADLQDRLNSRWPKGRTALPPKRELILTPLNATYKGRHERERAKRDDLMKPKMLSYTLETLPKLTEKDLAELEALAARPDSEIDLSDAPELTAEQWKKGIRGHFYRPVKRQITARVDADVLEWLKSQGKGYQSRIRSILRREMLTSARSSK